MRQVFSSQRVETVEGVAKLLSDAGIETHVTGGRSYRSKRSGQFSYLDKANDKRNPAVWVVHANDQPAAREILRQARLLETTRTDHPTAEYAFRNDGNQDSPPRNWAWRIRLVLLVLIAGVALFIMFGHRNTPTAPSAPGAPPAAPATDEDQDEVRVRIQPAQG